MSNVAISAQGVSKRYRIGVRGGVPDTLGGTIAQALKRPFRQLAKLRSLSKFEEDEGSADDVLWAVKDINFEITTGERIGIVGRNGAGKSTLLKILSRITEPTAGRVVTRGRVSSLLEVGTGFHPELTGRENVYLNGAVLGMSRAEISRKFDEIVDFSGVDKFLETPVKRYSSGMVVRLAFSVAAHLEPEILLVDEVLAVGDAEFQRKCLGKMESVTSAGRTVLFVSHNLSAVRRLCPRSLLLERGKLVEDASSDTVIAKYMGQGRPDSFQTSWESRDGPGGDEVRLRSVSLHEADGRATYDVNIEQQHDLKIVYSTFAPNLRFRVMARFYNEFGFAFPTIEPTEQHRDDAGIYESCVTIPANLLSEGEYTVGITIYTSSGATTHYVRTEDVISFHVFDPVLGTSARGDYAQNLHGSVRPLLPWRLTKTRD